jgi:MFS family permease
MAAIVMFGMNGFGYIEYGLSFYELFPQFDCTIEGVAVTNCSVDQIC